MPWPVFDKNLPWPLFFKEGEVLWDSYGIKELGARNSPF